MARSKRTEEDRISPSLSARKAIELIRVQLVQIEGLSNQAHDSPEVREWWHFTGQVVIGAFGKPSDNLDAFHSARHPGVLHMGMSDHEWQEVHREGLAHTKKLLESFMKQLEVFAPNTSVEGVQPSRLATSRDVFIVHGHDEGIKDTVARFVSKLELSPIVLHEKPDRSRTVIEKFEQEHRSAVFAIILMTPDDVGAVQNEQQVLRPRARQNVILELGFFLGKLGRGQVCVLYDPTVEKPSDYEGVLYIPLSDQNWKLRLVRELNAAGISVDANLAL